MGYDRWREAEPEVWDEEADVNDSDYEPTLEDELEYKERVTHDLLGNLEEFLSFSTTRDLIKLIAENL